MNIYRDIDTGVLYTESELNELYSKFKGEMIFDTFDAFVCAHEEIKESGKAQEIVKKGLFANAVSLMDDELREKVHNDLAPCSDEVFITAYMFLHEEKYGEEFAVN